MRRGHENLVSFVKESRQEGVHADIRAGCDEDLGVWIKVPAVARREALSQGIAQGELSSRDGVVADAETAELYVSMRLSHLLAD